jgi:hypothetical protein
MTPSGIEPVAFRFVAQYLNHGATVVPHFLIGIALNPDTGIVERGLNPLSE